LQNVSHGSTLGAYSTPSQREDVEDDLDKVRASVAAGTRTVVTTVTMTTCGPPASARAAGAAATKPIPTKDATSARAGMRDLNECMMASDSGL